MLETRRHGLISWLASTTLTVAAVGLFVLSLGSCNRDGQQMAGGVIAQNDVFTMTGDSIIEDTVYATAEGPDYIKTNVSLQGIEAIAHRMMGDSSEIRVLAGKTWHGRKQRPALMPEYSSPQPLVDATYNMSVDRIADAVSSSGRFLVGKSNYSRLYCSIYLSLAALKPHQSMATLRSMVDRDSIIMQREGQWPVVSDHIGWATAAWEVYKTTGDREWLAYCRRVIEKTLGINRAVLLDQQTGLIHGAGYTSSRPLGVRRMTWMGYNDLFACMSLGNNILTAHAYAVLGEMCDEMGIDNDYLDDARRIKDAINQHLWNEDRGCYSSFLYGMAFPRQAPTADNTSQAMCVLWGIADDKRAENLIAQTPVSELGVNVTYPAATAIEPYLAHPSWATTQALWNLAAASVGNENALRRGLSVLWRAQALYESRDIHLEGVDTDHLGTGASNAAMILRVIVGMNFKPEGIEFQPTVPVGLGGKKTLKGFNYRRAVLDFTVNGTGTEIEKITDNGTVLESPFLPNDISGHHHIVITLAPDNQGSGRVTIHHGEIILPLTPDITWSGDTGRIENFVPGTKYSLTMNGESEVLSDSIFVLPHVDGFTVYSVEIAGRYVNGFMSRPLLRYGLTPQVAFYPQTSSNDSAIVVVNVARGGDYLLDIGYRPTGTLDVRRVSVNSHPMGTVVMASGASTDSQDGLAYSNMVSVKMLKGENIIRFDQIRLPKSFTTCEPVHVRIISF